MLDLSTNINIQPGTSHIMSDIITQIKTYFLLKGFTDESVCSPIIDDEDHNFTYLNIPKDHPTREDHQSFFIKDSEKMLRTHTSNAEVRIFKKHRYRDFKAFTLGPVFRKDSDSTHTPMFHQVEIMIANKNISIPQMIREIQEFLYYIFEEKKEIRLRPSYFPFTEPSYEVDVKFGDKWLEVLGCGVSHHNIFKQANLPVRNAIAIGCGVERIAALKYDIKDIRELYASNTDMVYKHHNKIHWIEESEK